MKSYLPINADEKALCESIELRSLMECIFQFSGFDFRDYSEATLKRRVKMFMSSQNIETISVLQSLVLHDSNWLERFLQALSINVTALFRDPVFYLAVRSKVIPLLRTYPTVKIWVAGCATGEEAYSMAILLEEAKIYAKSIIYATDINHEALDKAKAGTFPLFKLKSYADNYQKAGNQFSLEKYYVMKSDNATASHDIKRNIIFAHHNLVTDGSFNEFNFILCRNVMIYFNPTLQQRVRHLIHESLIMFGILALGLRELLLPSLTQNQYVILDPHAKLYKKIG